MATPPAIQAQNIVNAAIQDSQAMVTNRTALYDYTDRVHQRILRESQWRFLLSDPQTFVTMPGVSGYSLTSTAGPAGAFQTPLQLTNFANIAPGTMYDLTCFAKIEEDSDTQTTLNYINNRDGSLRFGQPRTYSNSISNPGTIYLKPVPDANNVYYPVPETPQVTFAVGGALPSRLYWGVVTFVDSLGGESTPCVIPFTVAVPAGYLVTVSSPNPSAGGIAGNQAMYSGWNLYMGYAQGAYNRQNSSTNVIGSNWTETTLGISSGTLQVPSAVYLPPATNNTFLSITSGGSLQTTTLGTPVIPTLWALKDTNGVWWEVSTGSNGGLQTQTVTQNPATTNVFSVVYLTDTSGYGTWAITVTTGGALQSTLYAHPPLTSAYNSIPPTATTIQPLNAYVIQFRYYQTRNQIVNPTDILQIPYAYQDIVIAGVNHLCAQYMDRKDNREPGANTLMWKQYFEQGLAQIRRDLRVSYRKTDFIAPDQMSQYVVGNQQGIPTMGW